MHIKPEDEVSLTDLGAISWRIDTSEIERIFNPSICRNSDGRLAILARGLDYPIYFSFLDENLKPTKWEKVFYNNYPKDIIEDARLILRGSDLYINTSTLINSEKIKVELYKLNIGSTITAQHLETYPGKSNKSIEKNWITHLELEEKTFNFITDLSNGFRGGSNLIVWKQGYLALGHKKYIDDSKEHPNWKYTHVFIEFNKDLNITKTSKEFFIRSSNEFEFAMGLIQDNDQILISFGRSDGSCNFSKIDKNALEQIF
jgi:hypothetical protein